MKKDLYSYDLAFKEMEKKEDLFSRQVFNVYYWKLIRISVYNRIAEKLGLMNITHPNLSRRMDLSSLIRVERVRLLKNAFSRHGLFDNIVYRHRRRIEVDGKYVEVNTEYLSELLPELMTGRTAYVETGIAYNNRNIENDSSFLIISPFKSIFYSIFFRICRNNPVIKNELYQINQIIKNNLNVNVDLGPSILSSIKGYKLSYSLHKKYLRKVQAKKVFIVCSYGKEGIISAAKDLGIETYEIQHGMISPLHMGYSFPGSTQVPYFPDNILLYGDFWKKEANYPVDESRLIVVGSPYTEMQISKYSKYEREEDTILFISSGEYGKQLSKLAIDFHNEHPNVIVYYKLHPSEFGVWSDIYPYLKNIDNIKVVEDKINLYELFARCSFLVGVNSTAIYESFALETKVILYNTVGIEDMAHIIKEFHLPIVNNSRELYNMIRDYPCDVLFERDYLYKNIAQKITITGKQHV